MDTMRDRIQPIVESICQRYWPLDADRAELHAEVRRVAFNVALCASRAGDKGSVCDIGGGWGMFSAACAAVGMRSILIDDFKDRGFFNDEDPRQRLPTDYRCEVISRDVVREGIAFPAASLDVVTCFDSMEHWHASPKALFAQVVTVLRPGGWFILATPNCVNLRKRITVPFGKGDWSPWSEWYGRTPFRGHVREPNVSDLRGIARDMSLTSVTILGRNWMGHAMRNRALRTAAKLLDLPLRLQPSLCSDIYLVGQRPG